MDYGIKNKFSEAPVYAKPPCEPIPAAVFLGHLKEAALFLFSQDKKKELLRNREMYSECLNSYLQIKGIQEIVPDEQFFKILAVELRQTPILRKRAPKLKIYANNGAKRFVNTIAFLINAHLFPQKLTRRPIRKLITSENPYKTLNLSKLSEEFPRDGLIELLHEANAAVTANKKVSPVRRTHINIFDAYLKRNKIERIVPDESFLLKCYRDFATRPAEALFKDSPKTPYYSDIVKVRAVREIRILVNRYFLPNNITRRKILLDVERERYERFLSLTEKTQEAIAWFEEHGRRVKALPVYQEGNGTIAGKIKYIYQVTDQKLLPITTYGKINHVINFLNIVGKNGIELVDDGDLRKFIEDCDRKKLPQKDDYLAHLATFFINVQAQGFINDHPFKHIPLKMRGSNVRKDFISQEGIDTLLDLKTINCSGPVEVRNALACALGYDLGMRTGELYGLNITDVGKDGNGNVYFSLSESIQKGHKPKTILYLYFDETKAILKLYLEVTRPSLKPKDKALFVSIHDKERLNKKTLETQIREYMARRGVKTFYGKNATGHHLRHSLATLNIEPLGACLPLNEIVERLRHTKYETARKHYIHNNPYLQQRKFEALKGRIKKKTEREILQGMPPAELEGFLIEDLRLDPEIMREVRKKHRVFILNGNNGLPEAGKQDIMPPSDGQMGEGGSKIATLGPREVKRRITPLGIYLRTLTEYCEGKGLYVRRGRERYFVDSFIDELVNEWVPKEEVMKTFDLSRRHFYRLVKEKNWPTMKVGATLLVKLKKLVLNTRNLNG